MGEETIEVKYHSQHNTGGVAVSACLITDVDLDHEAVFVFFPLSIL